MPEDLKINVSVPGAKQAAADLHAVAGGEQAVGAAAGAGAAGVGKSTDAKVKAGEASHEFSMRNRTLLLQLSQLGPEFGIAANAINAFMTRTTSAGIALGFIGTAIGVVTYVMSKYNETQAEAKRKAEEVAAALRVQYDAYLKIVEATERAARGRGGAGGLAARGLTERLIGLAPEGVSPADISRVADLAAKSRRGLTDEELTNLMLQEALGKEPDKGTDRAKVQRMLKGPGLAALKADMATMPRRLVQAATMETQALRAGMTPAAEAADIFERIAAQETREGNPITAAQVRAAVEGNLADLSGTHRLRPEFYRGKVEGLIAKYPALGTLRIQDQYRDPFSGNLKPRMVGESGEGTMIVNFIGQNNSGVTYNHPGGDPAGVMPRSPMR